MVHDMGRFPCSTNSTGFSITRCDRLSEWKIESMRRQIAGEDQWITNLKDQFRL